MNRHPCRPKAIRRASRSLGREQIPLPVFPGTQRTAYAATESCCTFSAHLLHPDLLELEPLETGVPEERDADAENQHEIAAELSTKPGREWDAAPR